MSHRSFPYFTDVTEQLLRQQFNDVNMIMDFKAD